MGACDSTTVSTAQSSNAPSIEPEAARRSSWMRVSIAPLIAILAFLLFCGGAPLAWEERGNHPTADRVGLSPCSRRVEA